MASLFYQLIFNEKTKRWFKLLAVLEEYEQVTAQTLVEHTTYGRRTIMKDIKELKEFFANTIQLVGDETGYHFSFFDPQEYYTRKQLLLSEEKLFLFVDQLAAGKQLENYQWGYFLDIPISSFGRIKRRLQEILIEHYSCQLGIKTNQLTGTEADIRQFLYDFYFTLPLYPVILSDRVASLRQTKVKIQSNKWELDSVLLNQWLKIFKLRLDQGYQMPIDSKMESQQHALVQAFDQQVKLLLPAREKAALFLLSLEESQFLNPLLQKEFVRCFSPMIDESVLVRDTEALVYQLFETLVFLMKHFFQLPKVPAVTKEEGDLEETELLAVLISRFIAEKNQYSHSLYITYQLIGTSSLVRWIKKEVNQAFQEMGFHLIEAPLLTPPGVIRHVQVTNLSLKAPVQATIELPKIPNKETIAQALSLYLQ
ncbi:helix-turn-helix domain-containing protein [Enterococcus entomosocium]|jgi:hypothetical protein|uniref:Helix-turn-helix domain-containing protein n=2 Tax=Enterococcus TaxID=1350 RepID=A0ABV3MDV2_9ENTE|nr:HTH domain-containing protein [Enterococcus casseliflavus]MDF2534727.1 transcriptional regulator [Bacillales bacterium]